MSTHTLHKRHEDFLFFLVKYMKMSHSSSPTDLIFNTILVGVYMYL